MKQLIICISIMVFGASVVLAQGPGADRRAAVQDRVEAQRVAFITQKLELTVDESATFWPVYNEFRQKQKEMRESISPGKTLRQLNDAEAQELINAQLDLEAELVTLKRTYFSRLSTVVPARKLVRLAAIEQQFSREVLNMLRQRQQGNKN